MRLVFRHCNSAWWLILISAGLAWGFETPALLDNFNRAAGSLGADWTQHIRPGENSTMEIAAEQALRREASGNNASAYWDVSTFGPNVAVAGRFRDVTSPTGGQKMELYLRVVSPNTSSVGGYICSWQPEASIVRIERLSNNVLTTIAGPNSLSVAASTWIGCQAEGTRVTAWHDPGTGWVEVAAATDSTHAGAGYVGVGTLTQLYSLDDFSAASLVSAVTRRGVPLMAQ